MNLKIEKVAIDGVLVRMPFNPSFCADEVKTLLHGGVLTALLDSVFGLANFVAIDGISSMATLDLRVDYLRPAKSRADVMVRAESGSMSRIRPKWPVAPPVLRSHGARSAFSMR